MVRSRRAVYCSGQFATETSYPAAAAVLGRLAADSGSCPSPLRQCGVRPLRCPVLSISCPIRQVVAQTKSILKFCPNLQGVGLPRNPGMRGIVTRKSGSHRLLEFLHYTCSIDRRPPGQVLGLEGEVGRKLKKARASLRTKAQRQLEVDSDMRGLRILASHRIAPFVISTPWFRVDSATLTTLSTVTRGQMIGR